MKAKRKGETNKTTKTPEKKYTGNTDVFAGIKALMNKPGTKELPELQPKDYFYAYTYGIPIRNYLPLCRLLGSDVLPLSRAFTIVGKEETLKSSIGWFFMRLFLSAGGFCIFIDTEHKTSWSLVRSILDMPEVLQDKTRRVFAFRPSSKEQAQQITYKVCQEYEKWDDVISGGKRVPMGILYDSLKSGESEAIIESRETGEDTPGYSSMHTAKQFQETLNSSLGKHIQKKPITFFAVNHSMPKRNPVTGQIQGTYEPGGSFKDFVWTGNLEMSKSANNQDQASERNSTLVYVRMKKSSLNEKQTKGIPLIMEQRPDPDNVPHTRFFWDNAMGCMMVNADIFPAGRIKGVLKLTKLKGEKVYSSKALQLDSDNALSLEAVGGILNNSPKWQEIILRRVFRIEPDGVYKDGVIYKPVYDEKEEGKEGELNGFKVKYVKTPPIISVADNFWPVSARTENDKLREEKIKEFVEKQGPCEVQPVIPVDSSEEGIEDNSEENSE